MSHYLLSAEARFSAAHTLPGVAQCDRMHGHNWTVRVTVRVEPEALDSAGIGVDFRVLEEAARAAVEEFEHRYLNELPAFAEHAPTAERIARVVSERVGERLGELAPAARLVEVEVREMPEYRVIYRPE